MGEFSSAITLLGWANEDVERLQAASELFLTSNPYTSFFEPDPDSGDVLIKIRIAPVPDEICKLASHALWDIKHALDHATCAAVRVLKGTDDVGDLHFPICSHPNDLEGKLRKTVSKGSSELRYPAGLHDLFRSFEPYPTGNGYSGGGDEFIALSKLANTTKHAVALAAVPTFNVASFKGTGGIRKIFMRSYPDRVGLWDSAKHELTLGLVKAGSEMKVNLTVAGTIAFDEGPLFEDYPAGQVLDGYGAVASDIVNALQDAVC